MALSLTLALTSISCMTASKYARKYMDTSIVPSDFDPNKHILLLAEMPRKRDSSARNATATRKFGRALKKYYKYRYEIVSRKEIYDSNGKYKDTSLYKFAVLNSLSSYGHSSTTIVTNPSGYGTSQHSVSQSVTITTVDLYFYDRSRNKAYPQTGSGHSNLPAFSHAFAELIDLAQQKKR